MQTSRQWAAPPSSSPISYWPPARAERSSASPARAAASGMTGWAPPMAPTRTRTRTLALASGTTGWAPTDPRIAPCTSCHRALPRATPPCPVLRLTWQRPDLWALACVGAGGQGALIRPREQPIPAADDGRRPAAHQATESHPLRSTFESADAGEAVTAIGPSARRACHAERRES